MKFNQLLYKTQKNEQKLNLTYAIEIGNIFFDVFNKVSSFDDNFFNLVYPGNASVLNNFHYCIYGFLNNTLQDKGKVLDHFYNFIDDIFNAFVKYLNKGLERLHNFNNWIDYRFYNPVEYQSKVLDTVYSKILKD